MAWVEVEDATVDIPIFDDRSMSLKSRAGGLWQRRRGLSGAKPEHAIVRALDHVSLRLVEGDRVGLIGRNGSGKTTLLRVLGGIYEPTQGQVRASGRTCTLLDLMLGIDLEATGIENIYLRGYALGMTRKMVANAESEICEFSELGQRLKYPVRTYSAGMLLRLAFSISLISPHDIMLIDEVIGVGDASFLGKTRAKMADAVNRSQIVVVASHALDLLTAMCNKAIYLREGRIIAFGPVADVISTYRLDTAASSP
jgi:homopolymeric O-antigen transport system ATP-binding protein